MSPLLPLTLHSHPAAPNPWKVALILSALDLPSKSLMLDFSQVKHPSYTALNPNGRLPTIEDPNNGVVLWESGAIIEYLVETYDTSHTISYTTSPEKFQTKQWLALQISGQGPYFGQATWFARFHSEKLPSATARYVDEMLRIISVLDLQLSRNGTGWLVGEKCTYADLAFVTWSSVGEGLLREVGRWEGGEGGEGVEERFPAYVAWLARLDERREVKEVREKMAEGRKAMGLK